MAGTVTVRLKLTSSDASTDERLKLNVNDDLSVYEPLVNTSRVSITNVGANNIIQPSTDGQTRYLYVKHMGIDSAGAATAATVAVELTGDTVFAKLVPEEFLYIPIGGHALGVQLEASSGTVVIEYGYWTKA